MLILTVHDEEQVKMMLAVFLAGFGYMPINLSPEGVGVMVIVADLVGVFVRVKTGESVIV